MKVFAKFFFSLGFYTIVLGLLGYASTRSLNFVDGTLAAGDKIVGILALLASGPGALIWLGVFRFRSEGIGQKGVAIIMVAVDLIAEFALFSADSLLVAGTNGLTDELTKGEIRSMIIAMNAFIGANILAGVAFEVLDMPSLVEFMKRLQKDLIELDALRQIENERDSLSRDMVPTIVDEWRLDFKSNYGSAEKLGLAVRKNESNSDVAGNKSKEVKSSLLKTLTLPLFRKSNKQTPPPLSTSVSGQTPQEYFPIESRLDCVLNDYTIHFGTKLEAAKNTDGRYILRIAGEIESFADLGVDDFIRIVTGNKKILTSLKPNPMPILSNSNNGNGNGSHHSPQ